ncbi:MAG: hypothetical protein QNJ58_05290 [Desulfobacterales bacterium]|nr:hypothetical protein [Desulfobacterales bacterium]
MFFYRLVLGILCVWRITYLFYAEDGPWDAIVRFRRIAGESIWGKLLDCFHCLSLWIAAPIAFFLGETVTEKVLLWPALSAGAILIERLTDGLHRALPVKYIEDEEDVNGMLRPTETKALRDDHDPQRS